MPDVCVDLDAMQTLANRLYTVRDELSQVNDAVGGAIGSRRVEERLNEFVNSWKDGRQKIVDEIDSLIEVIRGASDTYGITETNLIDAMQGTGDSDG